MDKLTIEVGEGKLCRGCNFLFGYNNIKIKTSDRYCGIYPFAVDETKTEYLKCPACLKACQQYRDEHDYEKAREKISHILIDHIEFTIETKLDMILKELGYKEPQR